MHSWVNHFLLPFVGLRKEVYIFASWRLEPLRAAREVAEPRPVLEYSSIGRCIL